MSGHKVFTGINETRGNPAHWRLNNTSSGRLDVYFYSNGNVEFNMSGSSGQHMRFASLGVEFPNHNTVGQSANTVIDASTGLLRRTSSALRNKIQVRDLDTIYPDALEKISQLRPIMFKDKHEPAEDIIGFGAEEVNEIIPELVQWHDGQVESVNYDRIPALLVSAIKELKKQVEELQNHVNKMR